MNIVFRVDSSSQMGIGHLMRCLALAHELKRKQYQVTFICRELEGNLIYLVDFRVLILPKNVSFQSNDLYLNSLGATQEQDAEQTINIIPNDANILIVDNYALDRVWHKKLRKSVKKIMVIDDLADRQFDCDILLNQNFGSQKEDYQCKVPNDCKLLLGCDYALLRPEFSELRMQAIKKRKHTKEIKNILISMGGSDKNNVTYKVLQQLSNDFNITVALGGSSQHKEMIKKYAKNRNVKVVIDANNMEELMLNADLAIGAGGTTSWERCCLGLPTLLFVLSDNQRAVAKTLKQYGAALILNNLKKDIQKVVNNSNLWQSMSTNSQNICDGLGARRVEKYLNSLL